MQRIQKTVLLILTFQRYRNEGRLTVKKPLKYVSLQESMFNIMSWCLNVALFNYNEELERAKSGIMLVKESFFNLWTTKGNKKSEKNIKILWLGKDAK